MGNAHFLGRSLAAALILGSFVYLGGCSTQSVRISGEVSAPAKAGNHTVAVVSDYSMNHSADADQVAELVRAALRDQGFTVVSSQEQADIIVLPFFALLEGSEGFTPHISLPSPQSVLLSQTTSGGATMMDAGEAHLGLSMVNASSDVPPDNRVGLMVTAIAKETWSTLSPNNQNVPRIWRVTATAKAPPGHEPAYPSLLVKAAAPYFGKSTGGMITEKVKMAQ